MRAPKNRRRRTEPIHCQVRVTPELRERLDRFMGECGWSITQVVNEGIRRVVDETDVSARMAEVRQEIADLRVAFIKAIGQ